MDRIKTLLYFLLIFLLLASTAGRASSESSEIAVITYDTSGSLLKGAKIHLDDELIGKTSSQGFLKFQAKPGEHEIKVKKTGYETVIKSVQLEAGELQQLRIELRKETNEKPVARFSYSPEKVKKDDKVTFNATKSSDPDGTIVRHSWDLEADGTIDEKKKTSRITFKFTKSGSHPVRLKVTDDDGTSSFAIEEIEVLPRRLEGIDEKYALAVGITEYQREVLNTSDFPTKDAKAFYDLLIDDEMGGFPKENVTLLTNEQATKTNLENALNDLVTEVSEDDLVVIYYSGHGAQGPDYNRDEEDGWDEYFITYGTDPSTGKKLYKTGYNDDNFANKMLSLSSSKVAVFLDIPYAAGFDASAVLFAGSREEGSAAYEPFTQTLKEKMGHGVFTYYLLKGLRGKADKDKDGAVKVKELMSYLRSSMKEFTKDNLPSQQIPVFKGKTSVGNLVLKAIFN